MPDFFVADSIKDLALEGLRQNVDRIVLTVGEPTTFTNANTNSGSGSGQKVLQVDVDATDFTLSAGAADGRRIRANEQTGLTPVANATATHWCWLDVSESAILKYGLLDAPIALTTDGTATLPTHGWTIRNPTAAS